MTNKLTIGRLALFNHCDMGHIEAKIKTKTPLGDFYTCELKKVHMKNARLLDTAKTGQALLKSGREVDIFVQPQDLIKYL